MRLLIAAVGMAMLTACQPEPMEIEQPWVRLNAVPGRPAAGYMTIEGGGGRDHVLTGAASTKVGRTELHDAGMRPLPSITVKPGEEVTFQPGARHIMLYGMAADVKPGGTIPLQLNFEGGPTFTVEAKVVGAADPAP